VPRREDDFPIKVQWALANSVGLRCSFPECPQVTSGPHSKPGKAVNVGVAAHITAARPGGPRFDPTLSPEERRSASNGSWLCQTHNKLVDSDEARYSADQLRRWKGEAERRRDEELQGGGGEHEERRRYRSRFGLVRLEVDGQVIHVAWKGPLEEIPSRDPRTVTQAEIAAIYCGLCQHKAEPVQPTWAAKTSPRAHDVWVVAEDLTWKQRLKSPHFQEPQYFLRVIEGRHEPCRPFCARCGLVSASGGNNCTVCNVPLKYCPEAGAA